MCTRTHSIVLGPACWLALAGGSVTCNQGPVETTAITERAQPHTMKMTTSIPESITTPDRVETSIGTFEFFDGVPTKKSTEMTYDFFGKVNAYKALLCTIPSVSINELRTGQASVGVKTSNQICIYDTLMDSKSLVLTGNTSTMYALGFLDLEILDLLPTGNTTVVYLFMWLDTNNGPIVLEPPPNVLAIIDDFWFHYVTDVGRVVKSGKKVINAFIEPQFTILNSGDAGQPQFQLFFGVNIQSMK